MTLRAEDLRGEAADAYRMWRTVFNLSESAALSAVAQDGLVEQDGFDRAAATFSNIFGLTRGQARIAAQGRQSVSEAQRFWDSSAEESGGGGDVFVRAERALAEMSMPSAMRCWWRSSVGGRPKKTPARAVSAKTGPTVVTERGRLK